MDAGKDETARCIQKRIPNSSIIAFADPIKKMVSDLFHWRIDQIEGHSDISRTFREKIDPTWSKLLNTEVTPRWAMQYIGTDLFRDNLHKDFWVILMRRTLETNANRKTIIIPDCRFQNEVQLIKDMGGVLIKVQRNNSHTFSKHSSEHGLDEKIEPDFYVENSGDPLYLQGRVDQLLDINLDIQVDKSNIKTQNDISEQIYESKYHNVETLPEPGALEWNDAYDMYIEIMKDFTNYKQGYITPKIVAKNVIKELKDKIGTENKTILIQDLPCLFEIFNQGLATTNNITFWSTHEAKTKIAQKFGLAVINYDVPVIKRFDIAIICPPFSDATTIYYPKYFAKALDSANKVIAVMPHKTINGRTKPHIRLVDKHAVYISEENQADYFKPFGRNTKPPFIKIFIADVNINNTLQTKEKKTKNTQFILGDRRASNKKYQDKNGKKIPYTFVDGKLIYKNMSEDFFKTTNKKSDAPYLIFISRRLNDNIYSSKIIKNEDKNIAWGSGLFAFPCQTKSNAEKVEKWIHSHKIKTQIADIIRENGARSLSLQIIEKLPKINLE